MVTENIITLTEAASKHIQQSLANNPDKSNFRLGVKRTGCSGWMYVPELVSEPKEGDQVGFEINDLKIYVASDQVEMLQGTIVDYIDRGLGLKEMTFTNPNAESLCGCGESFNLKGEKNE